MPISLFLWLLHTHFLTLFFFSFSFSLSLPRNKTKKKKKMSPEIGKSNKIRHIVRIRQMVQRWRKKARIAAARALAPPSPTDVPAGHVAVCVGTSCKRFIVRATHLNHPIFKRLLVQAEEEYGFSNQGPLTIPCDESFFEEVLRVVTRSSSSLISSAESSSNCHVGIRNHLDFLGESRPLLHGLADTKSICSWAKEVSVKYIFITLSQNRVNSWLSWVPPSVSWLTCFIFTCVGLQFFFFFLLGFLGWPLFWPDEENVTRVSYGGLTWRWQRGFGFLLSHPELKSLEVILYNFYYLIIVISRSCKNFVDLNVGIWWRSDVSKFVFIY